MRGWALALLAALATGCADDESSVVCGEGTTEQGGVCEAGQTVDESTCGPGTHYDVLASACVADAPPTVCGDCTQAHEAADGSVTCLCGRDPGELCGFCQVLACPQPQPGRASVCGVVQDLATGDVLNPAGTGTPCDPFNPTADGPCALTVRLYDALELAADPIGAAPLDATELLVDDCGGFRAIDLEVPFSGIVAIVVDDATGDDHVPSVTYVEVAAGERRRDVVAGLVSRAADAGWTASAQDPFGGETFATRGAVFTRFLRAGTRVAGVELTCDGSPCSDAFYFADTDPWTATSIDPDATSTAPDGAALHTATGLGARGARGGLPETCEWPAPVAQPLAGFIAYEQLAAHQTGTPTTACE